MSYCHERGETHDFDTERGRVNAARHCRKCQAISLDWDDVPHFHYGQNIPGYLPMADEPSTCASWEGARDALADDIDRAADDAASMYQAGDDDGSLMASYESALQELRDWPAGDDIYVNVCSDGPHDLGVSYWVTACTEEECWSALEDDR